MLAVALTTPPLAASLVAIFDLVSDYAPSGDQPPAIAKLTEGVLAGAKPQTLLGITGSRKTFTIANVFKNVNKSRLFISHYKTLAHLRGNLARRNYSASLVVCWRLGASRLPGRGVGQS